MIQPLGFAYGDRIHRLQDANFEDFCCKILRAVYSSGFQKIPTWAYIQLRQNVVLVVELNRACDLSVEGSSRPFPAMLLLRLARCDVVALVFHILEIACLDFGCVTVPEQLDCSNAVLL